MQSLVRLKVTDRRGDWVTGLLLMSDLDRDNGYNVISPSRFKQSMVAKQ